MCSVIQTKIRGSLVAVGVIARDAGTYALAGAGGWGRGRSPPWNVNGKTSVLLEANIGPGYGSLVSSLGALGFWILRR